MTSQSEGTTCHASYWLQTMGFTLVLGSMLVKNYRILRIFRRNDLKVQIIKTNVLLMVSRSINQVMQGGSFTGLPCFPYPSTSTASCCWI